jgi:hypothetical protein
MAFVTDDAPLPLTVLFARLIEDLVKAVEELGPGRFVGWALLALIGRRLFLIRDRLAALVARVEAGTLRPARHRVAAPRPADAPRTPRAPSELHDHRFGWLLHLIPETGLYGHWLQRLLDRPEMAELVAAAPQAGRILRPFCRMLALDPPLWLALPRRTQPEPEAEPAKPAAPRLSRSLVRRWRSSEPLWPADDDDDVQTVLPPKRD